MKYLLCLALMHLLYSAVYAVPFIHYGRCASSLSDKAYCLPLNKCDYYKDNGNPTDAAMCNNTEGQLLVCCPKISPQASMPLLVQVKQPTIIETPETTEKPTITPTPIVEIRTSGINNIPQPPACGLMLSDRIYGGNDTQLDEFPWMVLIEYGFSNGSRDFQCGGSLINDRWVLTAAHCIVGLRNSRVIGVRLGEWNTDTDTDCITSTRGIKECAPQPIDMAIDRQLPHPLYDVSKFHNDIALLRLQHPVASTQFIKPICLPTKTELLANTFLGTKAVVSGWGRTEHNDTKSSIKLKAQLDVLSLPYCRQKYDYYHVKLIDNQMCAGGVLGVDSCGGDSGGPLMLELPTVGISTAFYQIGVVSFGKKSCGTSDTPGVYTRVAPYVNWIATTIQDNQN